METQRVTRGMRCLIAAGVLTGSVACGNGGAQVDAATAAAEVTGTWSAAFNAADATGLAALYADDARSLAPAGPALVGRGDIESYWRRDIGEGGAMTLLTVTNALAHGDALHVEGSYQVEADNGSELADGQYQQLWQRDGDGWRLQREMWRMNPTLARNIEVAQRLTSSWTAAYNQGDAKALVGLYSEDAVLSTVQEGSFEGTVPIESFWTRDFGDGKPSSTLSLTDAYLSGELAHLEGEYTVSDKGTTTKGRFVQLWMREGNAWRVHREMWLR
jgi:ketosteroid isomerase-like protein